LPTMTSWTSSGARLARLTASAMTSPPKCTAGISAKLPKNRPIAVRHALRITVSCNWAVFGAKTLPSGSPCWLTTTNLTTDTLLPQGPALSRPVATSHATGQTGAHSKMSLRVPQSRRPLEGRPLPAILWGRRTQWGGGKQTSRPCKLARMRSRQKGGL
jgi:hypothetical protein